MQASINNTGSQNKTPRPSLFGVPVRRESANFALGGAKLRGLHMPPPEVTRRAVSFGPPEVVTDQPYRRPNDYEHDDVGLFGAIREVGPVITLITLLIAAAYFFYVWFERTFLPLVLACVLLSASAFAEEEIVGCVVDNDLAPYTLGLHVPVPFTLSYEFETVDDYWVTSDSVTSNQTNLESSFAALDFTVTGYWIVQCTATFDCYAYKNGVWRWYVVNVDVFGVKNVEQHGGDLVSLSIDYEMTPK